MQFNLLAYNSFVVDKLTRLQTIIATLPAVSSPQDEKHLLLIDVSVDLALEHAEKLSTKLVSHEVVNDLDGSVENTDEKNIP